MDIFENSGVAMGGNFSTVTLNGILDPKGEHADMIETLAGIPDDVLNDIIFLCAGYGEKEIEFISKVASSNRLSCQLESGPENGGILHHAAVIAPVITTFGADFYPQKTMDRFINELVKDLKTYWKCGPEDFRFSSKNRLLFARGAALCFLVSEGDITPSWKNDARFIWVGSKFDDLKENVHAILDAPASISLSRDFLEEMSMDWVPNEAVMEDGSLNEDFETENADRLDGCSGPPSILTEDEWKIVEEISADPEYIMGPLAFPRWYLACLTYFTGEIREDIPFISTLLVLADGMDDGAVSIDDIGLMLMDFDIETLRMIEHTCFKYTIEQRSLVLDVMAREAENPDPDSYDRIQKLLMFVAATAPLEDAFISFDLDDDCDDDEIIPTTPEELKEVQSDAHTKTEDFYEYLDSIDDCFDWFETAISMEGYDINESNYLDLARGLTACHLINCNSIEDSSESTITNIGQKMHRIVNSASDLVLTRDLSREGLERL